MSDQAGLDFAPRPIAGAPEHIVLTVTEGNLPNTVRCQRCGIDRMVLGATEENQRFVINSMTAQHGDDECP